MLTLRERFDPDSHNPSIVDGMRIRVSGLKQSGPSTHAIEVLSVLTVLLFNARFELLDTSGPVNGVLWSAFDPVNKPLGGRGREKGGCYGCTTARKFLDYKLDQLATDLAFWSREQTLFPNKYDLGVEGSCRRLGLWNHRLSMLHRLLGMLVV